MKLKDQTFAVIAEKQNSISHKWFNVIAQGELRWYEGHHYISKEGIFDAYTPETPPYITIYTESEFEKLILQEEKESIKPPPSHVKVESKADLLQSFSGAVKEVYMATPEQIIPFISDKAENFILSEPKLTITNQYAREIIAEIFKLNANDIRIEP